VDSYPVVAGRGRATTSDPERKHHGGGLSAAAKRRDRVKLSPSSDATYISIPFPKQKKITNTQTQTHNTQTHSLTHHTIRKDSPVTQPTQLTTDRPQLCLHQEHATRSSTRHNKMSQTTIGERPDDRTKVPRNHDEGDEGTGGEARSKKGGGAFTGVGKFLVQSLKRRNSLSRRRGSSSSTSSATTESSSPFDPLRLRESEVQEVMGMMPVVLDYLILRERDTPLTLFKSSSQRDDHSTESIVVSAHWFGSLVGNATMNKVVFIALPRSDMTCTTCKLTLSQTNLRVRCY
jgi:hypothetical protein